MTALLPLWVMTMALLGASAYAAQPSDTMPDETQATVAADTPSMSEEMTMETKTTPDEREKTYRFEGWIGEREPVGSRFRMHPHGLVEVVDVGPQHLTVRLVDASEDPHFGVDDLLASDWQVVTS